MATWLTADDSDLLVLWPDVPMDDAVANLYLNAARDACLAYAPELIPATYEPATLTWPNGQTVTLTRVGDVVTAVVDPHGVATLNMTRLDFPAAHFMPYGKVGAYQLPAGPNYAVVISDGFGAAVNGLQWTGLGGPGPFLPGTVKWLADPSPGDGIPDGWRLAQALQARNIYNSAKASPGGDLDGSGYGISTFPLDWQVQQLLRPRRAMGAIA